MTSQKKKFRFSKLLLILLVGFLTLLAISQRWNIYDFARAQSYQPSQQELELGTQLNLTPRGSTILKASKPRLASKEELNLNCPTTKYEHANVLGCYSNRDIYVLDVQSADLAGVKEVTLAHELLHAVFERLSHKDQTRIAELLSQFQNSITDKNVLETIQKYQEALGDDKLSLSNEVFAVVGTEVPKLSSELEDFYGIYFSDRAKIVQFYQNYSAVFNKLQQQIESYDTELTKLNAAKDSLEADLQILDGEINSESTNLTSLKASGRLDEYNSRIDSYNNRIDRYNKMVEELKATINQYNQLVHKRNSIATSAQNLQNQLDSNYQER